MQWEHAPAIATQIYNAKADYVLALIANHPTLYKQVETWFKQAEAMLTRRKSLNCAKRSRTQRLV